MMRVWLMLLSLVLIVPSIAYAGVEHHTISASSLTERIQANAGKRQVVFVYASWCPHCRNVMPEMLQLARQHADVITAVSMDQKISQLKRYMRSYAPLPMSLNVWDGKASMRNTLAALGMRFPGSVPYIALLDEHGKVHQEGNVDMAQIRSFLQP